MEDLKTIKTIGVGEHEGMISIYKEGETSFDPETFLNLEVCGDYWAPDVINVI